MNVLTLSQWQFAITSVYHFFFVPLTIGLAVFIAIMETLYVSTGKELYKDMTKFWGKLFLINFAMGVVTGIVQEFQFGMNWSEYSRFVGDIFGVPLAIEALLAFFLESTFLGIWVFGWQKLSKELHLATIWLVAIGSNLSALWILIANSFMQQPVGYTIENGRAVMTDFGALLANANVWVQFPHTVLSGFVTASFFILGISTYHLIRNTNPEFFKRSFFLGAHIGLISILLVMLVGHSQMQHMVRTQPMKVAAAEALWNTEDPAPLSLFTWGDETRQQDVFSFRIPYLLSLLSYNRPYGAVYGIRDLQIEFEQKYGPGNYVPSVFMAYWTFRFMVGIGLLMFAIMIFPLILFIRNKDPHSVRWHKYFPLVLILPYVANSSGWLLTEMGRQPWIVYGLMKTSDAISPNLSLGNVLTTLVGFTLTYAALMGADIYLLQKYARKGPQHEPKHAEIEKTFWE